MVRGFFLAKNLCAAPNRTDVVAFAAYADEYEQDAKKQILAEILEMKDADSITEKCQNAAITAFTERVKQFGNTLAGNNFVTKNPDDEEIDDHIYLKLCEGFLKVLQNLG